MQTEDLLFLKALPLHESQVNADNLYEFEDSDIFHQFNVDLMFTLETMTTQFVTDPIPKLELESIREPIITPQKVVKEEETKIREVAQRPKQVKLLELSDHEDEKEDVPTELYQNRYQFSGVKYTNDQVGKIHLDEEPDEESQHLSRYGHQPSSHKSDVVDQLSLKHTTSVEEGVRF